MNLEMLLFPLLQAEIKARRLSGRALQVEIGRVRTQDPGKIDTLAGSNCSQSARASSAEHGPFGAQSSPT